MTQIQKSSNRNKSKNLNPWMILVIPLVLTLGIVPALQSDFVPSVEAAKAKGTSLPETGSKKVCGDRLCSEPQTPTQPSIPEPTKTTDDVVYQNGHYQLIEVSENLYSFGDSHYFSMVLVTDEGVIIGDPVNTPYSEEMLQAIRSITDQPIKYLIYSHNHWDHSAGGNVFKNEGATILSHVDARDSLLENPNPEVAIPNEVWEGNLKTIVLCGKTLELHHFGPSHGEGMTVFYLPDEKTIFIVDIATPKRLGFTILPDFVPSEWERTLIEVEKLDFETVMYGHKNPTGPASEITEIRVYLQDLKSEIFRMFQEGVNPMMIPSTIELPKYQDWEFYDQWLEMNTWRVILEFHMGW